MTEPSDLFLTEMSRLIKKGELKSLEIAESCLKNYDALNERLKAFISLDREKVLKQARQMDSNKPDNLGKLWGIPIAVKDLIDVAGEITTQGSSFFRSAPVAKKDAPVIQRLKKAGAICFGKTNLHEFAWGGTSSNPHFGICRNPWNPDYIPGGSSGGSAAAVAAGMVPGALGTDTLGSIRLPSAMCGIVGLKPTYGLLPTEGIFPLGYTLDHVGPMVRSVSDAEVFFKALLTSVEHRRLEDIRKGKGVRPSRGKKLKGIKVALLPSLVQESAINKAVWTGYLKAVNLAKENGAEVVDEKIPDFEAAISTAFVLTLGQASEIHRQRLAENPAGFGDDVRVFLEQGHLISAVDYIRAQRIRAKLVNEAGKLLHRVDAWIMPTTPNPATRVGEPPDPLNARFTGPINLLGFPSIALPSGLTPEGLPVSIQIIAAPFHEYLLLEIAAVIEEGLAFPKKRPIRLNKKPFEKDGAT
jgi:aspartyl-tRNA(Asn)/glutamyl-tRNA(Gln) amidotransferase subunit A